MIAVQGPMVIDLLRNFSKEIPELKRYRFTTKNLLIAKILVSRTGYTGEDGVEIILPASFANRAIGLMLDNAQRADVIKPAGLGARDSLRLEAGMPLYGHELTEEIDPLSVGLSFADGSFAPSEYVAFALLGVVAGVSAALFGVGGGVVMVPGLVLGVGGFSMAAAMGTSLLAMVLTATQGTRLAMREGRVDTSMVLSLAPTALLAAVGGVWLRGSFQAQPWLGQAFALFLLFAIFRLHQTPAK